MLNDRSSYNSGEANEKKSNKGDTNPETSRNTFFIHSWKKDRTNNIYTLKNVKKIVKEITYISKDYVTKIIISDIGGRHDLGVKENEEALTIN